MKTTLLISTGLACALLVTQSLAATDVVADWYAELASAQQTSHQDVGGRTRANVILRAALDSARNGLAARASSGRSAEAPPAGANLDAAAAQAAYSILAVLYPQSLPALDALLEKSLAPIDASAPAITAGREWGEHVAQVVLVEQSDAVFLNAYSFTEAIKVTPSPAPVPDQHAEAAAISPGRYRFSTLAGALGPLMGNYVDDVGAAARFANPGGIATDAAGNVYISEYDFCTVRKIAPGGIVTTLAGVAGQKGSRDGVGSAARFNGPQGLAVDAAGNLYVADSENYTIRKISPDGNVTTVAGVAGQSGHTDGGKEAARFHLPSHLAADAAGSLFVTEPSRPYSVRKITPDGTVATLTVTADYTLHFASQICADHAGNLYVNYVDDGEFFSSYFAGVLKLKPNPSGGFTGSALRPDSEVVNDYWATGIGIDEADNLIINYGQNPIVVYTPAGEFQYRYIAAGADLVAGKDMAVGKNGDLFTLPLWGTPSGLVGGAIGMGSFESTAIYPVIVYGPGDHTSFAGDAVQFTAKAVGSSALSYQWYFNSIPINGADKAALDLPAVQMADAGKYHVVVTDSGGSATSRTATLSVYERPVQTPTTTTPTTSGPANAASGGGSFDSEISLTFLGLLAAAARRRRALPDQPAAKP